MMEVLYAGMKIPNACQLAKRVYKKLFMDNAAMSSTDRKLFNEDVATIYWQYTLKPTTIPIQPYEDTEREYLEMNILQVNVRNNRRTKRLATLIHRVIPYPMLLLFYQQEQGQVALTAADKRINRADSDKIVVEALYDTGWLSLAEPTVWQADFWADFCITNFSYQNFYAFHQDLVRRLVALNSAAHTGQYALANKKILPLAEQVQKLDRIEMLEEEQLHIRNKLKKEKNLGTQVHLNVRMKQLADQITEIKSAL